MNATGTQCGNAKRDGAEDVGMDVEDDHDQADVGLAFLLRLAQMLAIKYREPGAEHESPAVKGTKCAGSNT